MTKATGDSRPGHGPEEGVQRARLGAEKVPGGIVGRGGLGNLIVRHWLNRVDKVREADGILDEEDGNVVSNDI